MRFQSQVYVIARGSVGGVTYTANQFHQLIARARTAPVNPKTTRQTEIRSAFSGAAELWKQATAAVRLGWNDYASTLIFEGPLGQYTVPGRQVFLGNLGTAIYLQSRVAAPAAILDTAPVLPGFLDIENVTTQAPAGPAVTGVAMSFTQNGSENAIGFCQRSVGWNPTRNRFKGPFLTETLDFASVVAPASGFIDFVGLETGLAYFMNPRFITAQAPFRMSALFNLRMIAVDVA